MNLISAADVYKRHPGETISAFQGVITKLGKWLTGTNDRGAWSLQEVWLNENGTAVIAKLGNREALNASMIGQTLYMGCIAGNRGLTGCYAKDDDRVIRNQTTRIISTTDTAEVVNMTTNTPIKSSSTFSPQPMAVPSIPPTATAPSQQPQSHPAPSVAPSYPASVATAAAPPPGLSPAGPQPCHNIQDVKRRLQEYGVLYMMAAGVATKCQQLFEERNGQGSYTPEMLQAAISSFYIPARESGLYVGLPTDCFNEAPPQN